MRKLFPSGRLEPLVRELQLPAPIETCFRRIHAMSPLSSFLASGGDAAFSRWSFIGCDPWLSLRSKNGRRTIETRGGVKYSEGDPLETLSEILAAADVAPDVSPAPFTAGGMIALSYDLGRHFERIPSIARDDLNLPDLVFTIYRVIIAHDRLEGRTWISAIDYSAPDSLTARSEAGALIERVETWMRRPAVFTSYAPPSSARRSEPVSNFTRDNYLNAVEKILEHILSGDIYQVNLSQRFTAPMPVAPIDYFSALQKINPAPFAAFLDCGSFRIISSSPERFILKTGARVETRPIKGTRRRGATESETAALAAELLSSEKDSAELAMIVDLERNDLGRVCRFGTVRVKEARTLEEYPTVLHLVATVEGELADGCGTANLLRATFPGGSITGCPKIRSMEIIEELEPVRRGFYTGSVGWLAFNGDMDLNIAIRIVTEKDGAAYFNVGGGIVADSDPAAEYQETLDKGLALARALAAAEQLDDENVKGIPGSARTGGR